MPIDGLLAGSHFAPRRQQAAYHSAFLGRIGQRGISEAISAHQNTPESKTGYECIHAKRQNLNFSYPNPVF